MFNLISILLRLPHDETTCLSLKRRMEYKSPYLIGIIHPNLIMLALHDLLNTPLYENYGITIHPHIKRKTPFFNLF
jgi:hypothetical protein